MNSFKHGHYSQEQVQARRDMRMMLKLSRLNLDDLREFGIS